MNQSNGASDGSAEDIARLRQEIDQTRGELGETVEALAARADVKARAKDATVAAGQQLKETASVATSRAKEQVRTTATALNARASELNARVGERLPEPARRVPPVAWLAAVAAAAAGLVAFFSLRRRRR